ncbi:helix-turn-helix transcriptional regulator [Nocardia acidivorans]|uniref:helix-turn-helix transcriptional regulator n=1 Tax=Nocardia acidivorans TaxID=404580 RepID=UPI001FDF994C|nr:helix-turn-helix domain-containing protein [Nocardia acidivorans]
MLCRANRQTWTARRAPLPRTNEWLSRKEVSEVLGFSPKTLANWALENKGPRFARIGGGQCRYRLSDVTEWQNSHFATTS